MTIVNPERSSLPPWVREKRQPTKAELAGKHFADGGVVAAAAPATPQEPDSFWDGGIKQPMRYQ